MTRLIAGVAAIVGAVALLAGPVGAHPLDPPPDQDQSPGGIPAASVDGHRGIECGEDASPAIGEAPFTCHAD